MKIKNLFLILLLAILGLSVRNVFAWVEPTTIPPGNNILAPLNSSAFGQSKVGGLILNLGNAAHGLIVRYGLVGIGTDNPQAKLDVRGETKTDSLGVRGNASISGKVTSTGLEIDSTTEGALLPRMNTAQRDAIANKVEGLLIYNTDTKEFNLYSNSAWKNVGGSDIWKKNGNSAYYNDGNVGIGTNGPVSKLDVRGKALFTRDGVGECCGNDATVMIGENTQSTGRRSSISFHNGGRHEGTFELAPDGERRFRMYDNQGARMGLETTGTITAPSFRDQNNGGYYLDPNGWSNLELTNINNHLCIRGDCRPTWSEPRRHCFWIRLETHWMAACPDGYHVDGMALTNASAGCWEAGCHGGQSSWVTAGGFLCCND